MFVFILIFLCYVAFAGNDWRIDGSIGTFLRIFFWSIPVFAIILASFSYIS